MAAILPFALMAGTSLIQAGQRVSAGKIQQRESEIAAKQEELGAIQREADRKGRLAAALASQTASAGARGIAAFEGSPLAILQEDIKAEERATERDIFQTKLSALTKRTRGKTAASQAKAQAIMGLLGSTQQLASVAPTPGG